MDKIVALIKPAFKALLREPERVRNLDFATMSNDQVLDCFGHLEDMEKEVMLAWANATTDINPTLLQEVKRGITKYNPSTEAFFHRLLGI